jgi:hypothetical protein
MLGSLKQADREVGAPCRARQEAEEEAEESRKEEVVVVAEKEKTWELQTRCRSD